jgi:hypothetical protein
MAPGLFICQQGCAHDALKESKFGCFTGIFQIEAEGKSLSKFTW